jgi:hypothetical protein
VTSSTALATPELTSTEKTSPHVALSTLPWAGSSPSDPKLLGTFTPDRDKDRSHTAMNSLEAPSAYTAPLSVASERQTIRPSPIEVLAEWNGCVTSVHNAGHYFSATLRGIVGRGVKGEEEDATIPISDVSESDKALLQPGNFFRLCVIYEVNPSGQPRRFTQVVFRRLPAYRQHDLDRAAERGREITRGLRVE